MKDFLLLIKQIKFALSSKSLLLVPLFLFGFLVFIFFANDHFKNDISKENIYSLPFCLLSPAPYPIINSFNKEAVYAQITAKAFVVMDDDSKVILFSRNPNIRFSMASTVKIMTALTALGFYKMDDILIVQANNTPAVTIGLKKGERISFENLLYGMLLPSGNDAALVLAQNYPGGETKFVEKMNENASDFHLNNTHFSDVAGLDDQGDYTTVVDLARLSSIALKNKTFAKIVSSKYKLITTNSGKNSYHLYNLNKLLGTDGVNGVKTGFTDEAGGVLVTSKIENGHTLIIVVMKSQDRFSDTKKLLSFISGNINFLNFSDN